MQKQSQERETSRWELKVEVNGQEYITFVTCCYQDGTETRLARHFSAFLMYNFEASSLCILWAQFTQKHSQERETSRWELKVEVYEQEYITFVTCCYQDGTETRLARYFSAFLMYN